MVMCSNEEEEENDVMVMKENGIMKVCNDNV